MRKIILTAAAIAIGLTVKAQDFDKVDSSPMDAIYYPSQSAKRAFAKTTTQRDALEPQIRVLYSRPAMKDRTIFRTNDDVNTGITKYGEKWRLGANESTELFLMKDAMIGDQVLIAGRYTIVVVPQENEWTIHINAENDGWGNYSHNADLDVVTTTVPVTMEEDKIENLSMTMYSPEENIVHLKMGWGTYRAELPIKLL